MVTSFRDIFICCFAGGRLSAIRVNHIVQDQIGSVKAGVGFCIGLRLRDVPVSMGIADRVDDAQRDLNIGIQKADAAGVE